MKWKYYSLRNILGREIDEHDLLQYESTLRDIWFFNQEYDRVIAEKNNRLESVGELCSPCSNNSPPPWRKDHFLFCGDSSSEIKSGSCIERTNWREDVPEDEEYNVVENTRHLLVKINEEEFGGR